MINRHKGKYFIVIFCAAAFFISIDLCEGAGDKEEVKNYLKDVSPILTNVDITIRNVGFNALSMKEGAKRMSEYIDQMGLMQCPASMSKQYKMMLLSFKKMRAGLLLFSIERKDIAVGLIRNGAQMLKYAAKDIVAIAEKEGIRKSGNAPEQKGK